MSMYSLIFKTNPMADVILWTLGLTRCDVGRFRDAFVVDGKIAVYTRNGGGNREHWGDDVVEESCRCPGCIIERHLPKHPQYLWDADDDFDSTYATIYFRFPDKHRVLLEALDQKEAWNPDERWTAYLNDLKSGKIQPPAELTAIVERIGGDRTGRSGFVNECVNTS